MPHVLRSCWVFILAAALPSVHPPGLVRIGHGHLAAGEAAGIEGEVAFLDTGDPDNGLIICGSATGLDPSQTYFSMLHDRWPAPYEPGSCGGDDPWRLRDVQMVVGFWEVASDGTGSLFVVKAGASYAPMDEIGGMSIRRVIGPPPGNLELRACARFVPLPSDEAPLFASQIASLRTRYSP